MNDYNKKQCVDAGTLAGAASTGPYDVVAVPVQLPEESEYEHLSSARTGWGCTWRCNTSLLAGSSYSVNPARRKVFSSSSRPNRSARA